MLCPGGADPGGKGPPHPGSPVPVIEVHLLSQHLQGYAGVPPKGDSGSVAQQCPQQALQPLHSPQWLLSPGQLPLQALEVGFRCAVQGRSRVPHLPEKQ